MLTCINKNSTEYRTLKDRSGISDSILEAICRDFLDKYDRFPYLDEIIGSNSDPYLRNVLQLDMYNGTSIQNLLSVTGTDTVEDANIVLNDQYRDVEVEITPLNKEAIVEITKRPTEDNFDNWTEEDEILAKAPRDEQGNLLAPNGKVSNLTEKQYAQVRTKAFKRWFGDWENDPASASKVVDENGEPLVVYHGNKDSNITKFVPNKGKYSNKPLYYFSSSKDTALSYATEGASTTDPNDYTIVGFNVDANTEEAKYADFKSLEDFYIATRNKGRVYEVFLNIRNTIKDVSPVYIHDDTLLKGKNNDGMISIPFSDRVKGVEDRASEDVQYVVLSPNQIKSATDNSGLFNRQSNNIYDPEPNGYLVFTNALNKLASLYGIKFNDITDAELASDKWRNIISDPSSVNAFVYNGQIYINISRANLDAPIHEMMHLFVGSIRFQNPNLYQHLISLSEQFPNYNKLAREFSGRTRNDINEEIFVQEVSRYLVGLPSNISNIESKLQYEITYNIKRVLDTILMGEDSVKTLSNDRLFNLSLKEIAREIHSSIMTNNFHGTLNVENSALHRKLNNIKSDLQSKGILKEYCD